MAKHRLCLIGCGSMANTHATRFSACEDIMEVTAVCDIVAEKAQALSDLLPNHPPVFTDYHEAIKHSDVVLVAMPHFLHASCSIDCLNAGKDVLLEKPMAISVQQCKDIMAAAERNNRILMIAYCMRFHPLLVELKRLLDEQVYGQCYQMSIWTEQYTGRERVTWANTVEKMGGGQLFSHGCHYVDLLLWMLGAPVSASHLGSTLGTEWVPREGSSNLIMNFESGAMAYHFGTWGAHGTKHGYDFQAHCTHGMIEADITNGKLLVYSNLKDHVPGEAEDCTVKELMTCPNAKPTVEELRHFLHCVETREIPLTNGPDSLAGLEVIWKIYEAEDSGVVADLRGMWHPLK